MNEIKIFENTEFGAVRTIAIDGEPYFVGKDVAEILAYAIHVKLSSTMWMKRTRRMG